MSAKILDGKILAQNITQSLKEDVRQIKEKTGDVPHLVNVMVGSPHSSSTYANSQKKVAEEIGFRYTLVTLPENTSQEKVVSSIKELNSDPSVHGIMIHKPLPQKINYHALANQVETAKDWEGINVTNFGKMILGKTTILPCTPAAVMELIKSTAVHLRGKEAVVVGRSEIVGKPLSLLLLEQHATVTICHSGTSEPNLIAHVGRADVVVSAVGKQDFIKGSWIKPGAIVIDVGINRVGSQITGDVEFKEAQKKAAFITPVPGGVGPVTVVMLMRNGIEAYKAQYGKEESKKI